MLRLACLLIPLTALVTLTACEQTFIIEGSSHLSPSIDKPTEPVNVVVVVEGFAAPVDGEWVPTNTHEGPIVDTFTGADVDYRFEQFGASPHALYVGSFLDLDGNGELDAGEPFGVFAGNPIIDAPWGATAPATQANITLDSFLETVQ